MKHPGLRPTLLALAFAAMPLCADTLVLRDGKEISGTLLSATTRQLQFLPSSGSSITVSVDTVAALRFSEQPTTAAPPPRTRPPARRSVIVPSGTSFLVRTIDGIDVDSTQAGAKFRGALADPIVLGGDVMVPRGADVVLVAAKVQQGGKMKGSDLVELKVNSISFGGRAYAVVTTVSQTKSGGEGKKTGGKIIGGAGLGAIIGGIAGGGKGAGIGALVGGAGGTVLAATGEPHLKIPAETRLQFQLASDWKIQ